ncbi:putative mitochondrial protein, partial [Mucuna pruriens]
MGTPVYEDSLDSCPLSSTDPTLDPLPSSPSHDSDIDWPIALRKALNHPGWRQAMIVEMQALEQSGTWELVSLPSGKKAVGCRWVFAIKVTPNGTVDRLKAWLVSKGYTQVYDLDYGDTFSPIAKITTIRLLLAMVAIRH